LRQRDRAHHGALDVRQTFRTARRKPLSDHPLGALCGLPTTLRAR
jgi:hypothetical protein